MKNVIYTISLVTLASILVVACVGDELWNTLVPKTNDNTNKFKKDTYLFVPALVDAVDELVQQLSVPAVFRVQKIAEGIADGEGKYNQFPRPQDLAYTEYLVMTENPALKYTAHAAPKAMLLPDGNQLSANYHGGAFASYRGSWNGSTPAGYTVGSIRFEYGQPTGFHDFLSGFLVDRGQAHFGRPVGLAVTAEGALLVSDDTNGIIYIVTHQ